MENIQYSNSTVECFARAAFSTSDFHWSVWNSYGRGIMRFSQVFSQTGTSEQIY